MNIKKEIKRILDFELFVNFEKICGKNEAIKHIHQLILEDKLKELKRIRKKIERDNKVLLELAKQL